MKRILGVFLAVVMLISCVILTTVSVFAAETNVAIGSTVTSSGYFVEADPSEAPEMAVDGDVNTKWCARQEDVPDLDIVEEGHWIQLDLGKENVVSKVILRQASECERDIGSYEYNLVNVKMEVSVDGTEWFTLYDETELFEDIEGGEEFESYTKAFEPISIRYFKLTSTQPALDQLTIRLPEIEVYTAADGATPVTIQAAIDKINADKPTPTPTPATPTPAPVTPTPANTPAGSTNAPATSAPVKADEGGNTTLIIIIAVAAVAVIGGGCAAFFTMKKKKK